LAEVSRAHFAPNLLCSREVSIDESTEHHPIEAVRDFARAWERGDRPAVVDYLGATSGSQRAELAANLIRVELDHRTQLGEEVRIDEYVQAVPELRDTDVELVALLIDEHALRTEAGQIVTLDEYARRFPEHLETLRNELGLTDDRTRSLIPSGDEPSNPHDGFAEDDEPFESGRVIGDFRIERLLGAGGVSQVFLATQLSLDREVALKVTVESDEETSAANEGRTMAALSHPHIVPVFAEERIGRLRLLAMEYVPGPTLCDFLSEASARFRKHGNKRLPTAADAVSLIGELSSFRSGEGQRPVRVNSGTCSTELPDSGSALRAESPRWADATESRATENGNLSRTQSLEIGNSLDPKSSCRDYLCGVVRDLARALAAAAAKGVLHSDVKPANVLFTREGKALLADFNVSFRHEAIAGDPPPVGGTLLYMSPEQLGILTGSDTGTRIDERSDIYSLGLVLFESLTGGWAFLEGDASADPFVAAGQLQASRLSSSIEFPTGSKWLTPGLKSIIEKCLTPQPSDRYASADELAEDLDRFLSHRPLRTAADPSRVERVSKWLRRSPLRAVLWGTVLVSLALFLVMTRQQPRGMTSQARPETGSAAADHLPLSANDPKQARASDMAGQRLLNAGDFKAAEHQFELATTLNPQMATAWHNLGVARFRLGEFADALSAFDRSIALGNESGRAYSHRAAARFALGDESGAEADFETAMQIASVDESAEVRSNLRDFETLRASRTHPQTERPE
jgi:serine/threonine protein kinase